MANMDKVFKFDEIITYQEGSIVSKEIIKQEKGTVTIFAFDAGQGLSEHVAPFDAMVQIIDGEAEILIDGIPNIVSAGEAIIMPGNVRHALKANKPFKMILTMIKV